MRLIDADELIEEISSYQYDTVNSEIRKVEHTVKAHICELVEKQPTAYDVDKVVGRLEEKILNSSDTQVGISARMAFGEAIKIVKSGGIE